MARLIKSEKEVEGRYEEVWTLVEEDALDQWPAGPGDVVGRPAVRLDGYEKARGIARYTGDLQLPGTLHAALLRSPFARCRVKRIDLAAAAAAPGVLGVLGPGEVNGVDADANFEGSAVAAVAAETFAQAEAAVRLIDVEWEELEPLLDADEAVRQGSLVAETRRYERGDYEAGIAAADAVVEGEYRTQTLNHNPLETHQCVCQWRGDALDVYVSTQYIWGTRNEVAAALELPPDKVRVICEFMGGGFGAKAGLDNSILLAAELAKQTGHPVACAVTRRDENVVGGNRNATRQRVTAAARADGTLTALGGEFTCALGWDGWLAPTAGPVQLLYACDNVSTVEHGAKLNLPPMTAFRAPGFVEGTWSLECLLDKLAAQLGVDPLELRKLNYAHVDTMDGRSYSSKELWSATGEPSRTGSADTRCGRARTRSGSAGWAWRARSGTAAAARRAMRGSGSARDGSANVVTAMQDIGTGTRTAMAQIAAEELGLTLDRVTVQLGDSARGPFAVVSGGSSTLPSMGPAVRSAAADAASQVIELAAQRFELEERVLSLKGGQIVSSDGGSWPLEEITGLLDDGQILGKGARGPNPAGMRVLTFGIQLAEVAVDIGTGEVVVEKIVAIHDIGRVINPLGARSQIEGGIIQALGHTFSEVRLDDPQTGMVLTKTLDAYKLPTIADVPEIVCEFIDVPDAHLTNLGSKGLGEPPIVPTAAAIGNAIRDATGADVTSLPINREEILRALREADARKKEPVAAGAA